MKITAIKQQVKRAGRYSVYVDGRYEFSLSDTALLSSKLAGGQEISGEELKQFKQLSSDDKLYSQVLNYIAIRPRTRWEIETYLKRKHASPALFDLILNTLSNSQLIDDEKFARAWISDRQLLRPTSRRKLILELKQKHVKEEVIQKVMSEVEPSTEQAALSALIIRLRRQTKYQDDLKLMQYLARQGFGYGDIKAVLTRASDAGP